MWDYKLTVFIHGNVGPNKDNVLCLGTFDEPCPRCEEVDVLRQKKEKLEDSGKSTKEVDELIGSMAKRKRSLYNIVVLDSKKERKKGVQLWQAPHASIEDALTERARDKKTGEIIPYGYPEEGKAVYFEKSGSGLATEYTAVDLVDHDLDEEDLDLFYEQAYDLEDVIEVLSYEDFCKKCYGASAGEEEAEEDDEEEEEEEERSSRGRSRSRKKRYQEEDEDEEEEEDDEDNDEEDEEEDEPPRKGRARKSRKRVEEEDEDEDEEDEKPDCFGVQFGSLEDCEDCDDDLYKECMMAHKENKKKKRRRGRS